MERLLIAIPIPSSKTMSLIVMKNDTSTLLIKLRRQHHFSQEDIAEKLKISQSSYCRIEAGKKDLLLSHAKILANLYGVEMKMMI